MQRQLSGDYQHPLPGKFVPLLDHGWYFSATKLDSSNLEDEWNFFSQKFNLFLLTSGSSTKSEQVRLAMFLNFIGDEALKVFNTFTYAAEGDKKKLDIVMNKFKEYCTPRKNVVHERFLFWRLTQQPGESVDTFVTTLRLRAASCQFGD